jgi:digeranylgeranylglycerophospholipid reductase
MHADFDVIVVGAGPGGSVAAERLAQHGLSVLLLDRRAQVGVPSHCAGIIRRESLRAFSMDKGPWVRQCFDEYQLAVPGGGQVSYRTSELGALLVRHEFDQELALRAVRRGAELALRTKVLDVVQTGQRVRGVVVEAPEGRRTISCQWVIAADGVASRVAAMAGIDTEVPLGGLAVAVKAVLDHAGEGVSQCRLHLGRQVAPGGYIWVLPLDPGSADIGAGINPRYAGKKKALDFVHEFVAQHFPGGTLRHVVSHALSATPPHREIVYPGLVLVGEAARQTNPLTGAGIYTAMSAGALAAEAIAKALASEVGSDAQAMTYAQAWSERFGGFHQQSLAARQMLDRADDTCLWQAARALGPHREHRSVAHALMDVAETSSRIASESLAADKGNDHVRI